MATIREAFEYAAKNPNSDFAKNLAQLAKSGALDVEARKNGLDLSPFKTTEQTTQQQTQTKTDNGIIDKITNITGGTTIAKGLGQGLAYGDTSKVLEQNLKGEGEQQQKLIEAIRKNKAEGKDTLRLEKALATLTGQIKQTGDTAEQILNPEQITGKQVAGDALQLATTVGTMGSIPGVASEVKGAQTVGQGILKGAKIGATTGAISGGASGVAQGLKNDATAEDIAKEGLLGAAGGALVGGAVGAVSGGIAGKVAKNKLAKEEFVKDLVMPKATEAVKIQALKEGRITEQGLLDASKITPSKKDLQLANAVKGIVSEKNTIPQNISAIDDKVQQINSGVKAYVKANKVPFNTNQLKTQLNAGKDELNLIFASDTNAEKTYNAVVKEFIKGLDTKDTSGLLQRRQEFDKIPAIKKLLDSQGLGENTRKEVVLTVRDMANRYISNLLPKGNKYREALLNESKMIQAIENIAEKNTNIVGANKLQSLTQKYPILKWLIGGAATGAVGAAGVGVGSAIIGSTD